MVSDALVPSGPLHVFGAVLEPIPMAAFSFIADQKSIPGSPVGSASKMATMLELFARHNAAPRTDKFSLSRVNDGLEHLRTGKARYRIVLENDIG